MYPCSLGTLENRYVSFQADPTVHMAVFLCLSTHTHLRFLLDPIRNSFRQGDTALTTYHSLPHVFTLEVRATEANSLKSWRECAVLLSAT